MMHSLARWVVSLPASMFYCLMASSLADQSGSAGGAPGLVGTAAAAILASAIALWILQDARRLGRSVPFDYGTFLYMAYPLLAPVHLFSTRGWRAFAPLGCFALIFIAALVTAELAMSLAA